MKPFFPLAIDLIVQIPSLFIMKNIKTILGNASQKISFSHHL